MELQMVSYLIEQHHQQRVSLQQALQASLEGRKSLMKPAMKEAIEELKKRQVSKDECCGKSSCPICLIEWLEDLPDGAAADPDAIAADDMPFVLEMPCKHIYHPHCLQSWLTRQNTCPVCRHEIAADGEFEEDEEGNRTRVEETSSTTEAAAAAGAATTATAAATTATAAAADGGSAVDSDDEEVIVVSGGSNSTTTSLGGGPTMARPVVSHGMHVISTGRTASDSRFAASGGRAGTHIVEMSAPDMSRILESMARVQQVVHRSHELLHDDGEGGA
jgi:hypothetical protein